MNVLQVFLKGYQSGIFLYFKDWKDAAKARDRIYSGMESLVSDDYGHELFVNHEQIAAVLISDVDRGLEARVDVSARESNAQRRATAMNQGPLVVPRMA